MTRSFLKKLLLIPPGIFLNQLCTTILLLFRRLHTLFCIRKVLVSIHHVTSNRVHDLERSLDRTIRNYSYTTVVWKIFLISFFWSLVHSLRLNSLVLLVAMSGARPATRDGQRKVHGNGARGAVDVRLRGNYEEVQSGYSNSKMHFSCSGFSDQSTELDYLHTEQQHRNRSLGTNIQTHNHREEKVYILVSGKTFTDHSFSFHSISFFTTFVRRTLLNLAKPPSPSLDSLWIPNFPRKNRFFFFVCTGLGSFS